MLNNKVLKIEKKQNNNKTNKQIVHANKKVSNVDVSTQINHKMNANKTELYTNMNLYLKNNFMFDIEYL